MAKAKSHKDQHFVSKSYLQAWCDPSCPPAYEPYVWVCDRERTKPPFKRAPQNLFTENDLYTIERIDGTRDLRLEEGLCTLEGHFIRIRDNIFSVRQSMQHEDWVLFCAFVAAAQFRTPRMRDHHKAQWENALRIGVNMEAAMARATPAQRKAASIVSGNAERGLTLDQVRQVAAKPLQSMMPGVLRSLTPMLCKMRLAIFCTEDPIGFITSDAPCVWDDPELERAPPLLRSPALVSPTIEITMPVSPHQCAMLSWHERFDAYIDVDARTIDETNRRCRAHCNESFVVRTNEILDQWFSEIPPADNAATMAT